MVVWVSSSRMPSRNEPLLTPLSHPYFFHTCLICRMCPARADPHRYGSHANCDQVSRI